MELPERDSLGLAMFAAWLNVRVDQIPAENRIHTSPDTMAAWDRVAKAAIRAMLDGVEPCAWRYHFPGDLEHGWQRHEFERRIQSYEGMSCNEEDAGCVETPLYSLDALKEAVKP